MSGELSVKTELQEFWNFVQRMGRDPKYAECPSIPAMFLAAALGRSYRGRKDKYNYVKIIKRRGKKGVDWDFLPRKKVFSSFYSEFIVDNNDPTLVVVRFPVPNEPSFPITWRCDCAHTTSFPCVSYKFAITLLTGDNSPRGRKYIDIFIKHHNTMSRRVLNHNN